MLLGYGETLVFHEDLFPDVVIFVFDVAAEVHVFGRVDRLGRHFVFGCFSVEEVEREGGWDSQRAHSPRAINMISIISSSLDDEN